MGKSESVFPGDSAAIAALVLLELSLASASYPFWRTVMLPFLTSVPASIANLSLVSITFLLTYPVVAQDQIQFQRDIRPILADTCFKCHGPDAAERQADLRLDTRQGAIESEAIIPGNLDASSVYQRIISQDASEQMPPPESGRKLSPEQKEKIKRWIEQGAKWQQHWSLIPPTKPTLPVSVDADFRQWTDPIDRLLLKQMRVKGLSPNREAKRETLIRRVSLDLTGLPPTPSLRDKYVKMRAEDWYEQLVDQLLQSPAYGEHMARFWLDAARYGDTHGLHLDNYREMWLYRDWVVNAFNQNLSYRDFVIQQLAGDMLENPTQDQLIASGFNRAHVTTSEGGSIAEEVYVRNVVDRVSTTGTVFMGLTVGCAQCHDHKFDPISQREFYQLFAFFNNMTDPPLDKNIKDPKPVIKVMDETQKQQQQELTNAWERSKDELEKAVAILGKPKEQPAGGGAQTKVRRDEKTSDELWKKPREHVWIKGEKFPIGFQKGGSYQVAKSQEVAARSRHALRKQTGQGILQHFFTGASIPLVASGGDELFAYVYLDPDNPPEEVMLQFNDGTWEHRVYWGGNQIDWGGDKTASRFYAGPLPDVGSWVRLTVDAKDVGFDSKSLINGFALTQYGGLAYWDTAGIVSRHPQKDRFESFESWLAFAKTHTLPSLAKPLVNALSEDSKERSEKQTQQLRRYYLLNVDPDSKQALKPLVTARDRAKKKLDDFHKTIPTTLVSKESDQVKDAFILERGEYDQKGAKVQRLTPTFLPPMDDKLPVNRLGFAKWLTSGQHPLTARVTVNRFWQQVFGTGIVKTSEDFGAQGEHPSHPELLDWLAIDFVEHGWDVQRLMKTLVMTRAYRQSSAGALDDFRIDPENRLLARGPRYRLDAETLRDQALMVSGLLNTKMGGPSVKPPQPLGLWMAVGYSSSNTVRFKADQGAEKIYRRSLYTFWKRTAPPPQMSTFDAPSREECRVRRERTNTPLQALLLMNEPQFVEAGKFLAYSILAEEQDVRNDQQRVAALFQRALGRRPTDDEAGVLIQSLQDHEREFLAHPKTAEALLTVGESTVELGAIPPSRLAALTMVASLVMNMDEFLNKN